MTPGISAHEPSDLRRQSEAVANRVARRDEDRVGAQQPDAGDRDGAVPGDPPVERRGPLECRQPGQQRELHEREVGAQQAGQPSGAHERGGEISHVAETVLEPKRDDDRGISGNDCCHGDGWTHRPPTLHGRSLAPRRAEPWGSARTRRGGTSGAQCVKLVPSLGSKSLISSLSSTRSISAPAAALEAASSRATTVVALSPCFGRSSN